METITKAKRIGGSIGVIIPKEIVKKERIKPDDKVKFSIEKADDLSSLWGKLKDIKKSTQQIMKEIDEGEESDY